MAVSFRRWSDPAQVFHNCPVASRHAPIPDIASRVGDPRTGCHQSPSASESMATGVRAGKETVGVAGNLSGQARSMAGDARQSIARLIDEQPILMAALGAALGAAVGAALPLSQAEKDLLGETGAKAISAG